MTQLLLTAFPCCISHLPEGASWVLPAHESLSQGLFRATKLRHRFGGSFAKHKGNIKIEDVVIVLKIQCLLKKTICVPIHETEREIASDYKDYEVLGSGLGMCSTGIETFGGFVRNEIY